MCTKIRVLFVFKSVKDETPLYSASQVATFPHTANDPPAKMSAFSNPEVMAKLMFGPMGFEDGSAPFDRPGQPRMVDSAACLPMPHLRDGPGVPILNLGIVHAEHNATSLAEIIRPLMGTVLGCGALSIGAAGGGPDVAEVVPRGVGKEKPVEHILNTLREAGKLGMSGAPLDRDDCISFGDGLNDLSMLRWAGVGVSMGNPESAEVTTAANLATASVEEEGVPQVVEDMLTRAGSVREFKALVTGAAAAAAASVVPGGAPGILTQQPLTSTVTHPDGNVISAAGPGPSIAAHAALSQSQWQCSAGGICIILYRRSSAFDVIVAA